MSDNVNVTFNVTLSDSAADGDAFSPVAEVDTRELADGGLNARTLGKTSDFNPGDSIYCLLFLGNGYTLKDIRTTSGSTQTAGQKTITIEDTLKFEARTTRTASTSRPCAPGGITPDDWVGNETGALTVGEDMTTVSLPALPTGTSSSTAAEIEALRAPYENPGIAEISYTTTANAFILNTPTSAEIGKTEFSIDVYIECEPV